MTDLINTPIEQALAEEIIKRYFTYLDKPLPNQMEINWAKVEFMEGWIYPVEYYSGPTRLFAQFIIKEYPGGFAIGVIPEYHLAVYAEAPIINYSEDEIIGFDEAEERFWDYFNNCAPAGQKFVQFMKTEFNGLPLTHTQLVLKAVRTFISNYLDGEEKAERDLIFWYVRDVQLPAFLDQTSKHMALQMMEPSNGCDLGDVVHHIVEETHPTEGHISIEDFMEHLEYKKSFNF